MSILLSVHVFLIWFDHLETWKNPVFVCPGDHGQPGPAGFRGPEGPDAIPDKPGTIGDPGFRGPKGYQGKKKESL